MSLALLSCVDERAVTNPTDVVTPTDDGASVDVARDTPLLDARPDIATHDVSEEAEPVDALVDVTGLDEAIDVTKFDAPDDVAKFDAAEELATFDASVDTVSADTHDGAAHPDIRDDAAPLDAPVDATVDATVDAPRDADVDVAPRPRVLLIGIDGVRYDTLMRVRAPSIRALGARGVFSRTWLYALPMSLTLSGPGWSTIATGVWPDKHRVRDNDFTGENLATYPDFLTRIERAAPSLNTYAIADWPPINASTAAGPVFGSAVDTRVNYDGDADPEGWSATDARITREASERLRTGDLDAAFVYLGNPDITAHSHGAGALYEAAIETADAQVGELIAAVEARSTYAQESWLIVVTTDHGHVDAGGHGGSTWQERQSFVAAAGGAIPRGPLAVQPRNVDVVPTILAHLGVRIDPAWGLDGVALGTPTRDPFDALATRLLPAVQETGVPAGTLGWTRVPPAGWSIDNERMTSGGTTEWRGWTFVDEAFWCAAEPSRGREAFVRSRGVIAVADPAQWCDVGDPSSRGTFDSALSSPPFSVAGRSSVRLRFGSHYRQDGSQKAVVEVSFDGGAGVTVLRYGPDATDANAGGDVISRIESLPVTVPRGASAMVARWRLYDARNNWFWAIDDAVVE